MRKLTILLLVALLALVAVACGDDDGGSAGEPVLTVSGAVAEDKAFTMADLEGLGVETLNLEHPKNGPGDYTGVRLSAVLAAAAVGASATTLTFVASDGYEYEAALADVAACTNCLLTLEDDGTLRTAMPGMESKAWVKDIVTIIAS